MTRKIQRLWMVLVVGSASLLSCSHELKSPQPTGNKQVQPDLVCNAKPVDRELTNVVVKGDKFTPMPSKVLEGDKAAKLVLPKVELIQGKDLAGGAPATATQIVVPDDPNNPAASQVHWKSEQEMSFDIKEATPPWSTGVFSIKITNPDGSHATSIDTAFAILPPPAITGTEPKAICDDQTDQNVNIIGTNFLHYVDAQQVHHYPTVTLSGTGVDPKDYEASAAEGCVAVVGNFNEPTVELCTSITITIKQGDFKVDKATKLSILVVNPAPADCASAIAAEMLTIEPPPKVTGVQPNKVCEGGSQLGISGENFMPGAIVTLHCPDGDFPATNVIVTDEKNITATFGPGPASPASCEVIVRNQDSCEDRPLPHKTVNVVPGPMLYYVDPDVVWNGVATNITLYSTAITAPTPASIEVSIVPDVNPNNLPPTILTHIYQAGQKYPNRVQAIVPKGQGAGVYDVILKDDSGCLATMDKGLTVVEATTVNITSIVPPFGWTNEDTAVQINGGTFVATPRIFLNPAGGASTDPATELVSISFGGPDRVSAVVPKGTKVGTYDVILVNPDGTVGVSTYAAGTSGYAEVELQPPTILSATPASIVAATGQVVRLDGTNFSNPNVVTLSCVDANYAPKAAPAVQTGAPTCNGSACSEDITINGSTLAAGDICVVRLTNSDNAYAEYSAIGVTTPSLNLNNPHQGTEMNVGRRALAAAAGNATPASRYVYAIGGDDGTVANAFDSTEFAPVDLYGKMGAWTQQKYVLGAKRTLTGAVTMGRYIYVVGGDNGAGPVATAERAMILSPRETPEIRDADLTLVKTGAVTPGDGGTDDGGEGGTPDAGGTQTGLGKGQWHYRVSAVFDAADLDNPGGESLPSDEFSLKLPELPGRAIQVKLFWTKPLDGLGDILPNITGYRIYRTPQDGASGSEQLLAEVAGADTLEYLDDGSKALDPAVTPLPQGSTGKWLKLPDMATARSGLAVVSAFEPGSATDFYIYGLLGNSGAALSNTYDFIKVSIQPNGRHTVASAWTAGANTAGTARWQGGAWSVDNKVSSLVAAGTTYIYAGAGVSATTTAINDTYVGQVQPGGAIGAFALTEIPGGTNRGYGTCAANGQLFSFGGGAQPSGGAKSAEIVTPRADLEEQLLELGRLADDPRPDAHGQLGAKRVHLLARRADRRAERCKQDDRAGGVVRTMEANMRRMAFSMMAVAGLLVPAVAQAQSPDTSAKVETSTDQPAPEKKGGLILAGARVGGIVPFSGLSPFVTVGIEVGYVFPWLNQALGLAVHMDYTEPKKDGTQTDTRLNGDTQTYNWKLREQEFTVMPVVMYRLTMLGKFVPYVGVGPRIYMLKSTTKASVGATPISETTEKNTKVGVGIPLGVEYSIGPGGIIAELLFQYGGLDHKITGATNTGALSLALGYRFLF